MRSLPLVRSRRVPARPAVGGPGAAARRSSARPRRAPAAPAGRRRTTARLVPVGDRLDEVFDLVREPVLVAEHVAGRPPRRDVGVLRLGDEDLGKPCSVARARRVVELSALRSLEVEGDRAARARDLDAQRVLAAGARSAWPRRCRARRRLEAAVEQGDVVDGDLAELRRRPCPPRPLPSPSSGRSLTIGVDDARDAREALAGDELGEVDGVGADVAERARAGVLLLQAPRERALGVDEPVLQVRGAHLVYVADAPGGDEVAGEGGRGDAAVGEADHRRDAPAAARSAAAAIASASSTVFASGFSHSTCLPASSAAIAISAWESPGVTMSTMSMSSRAITSRQSVADSAQPHLSAAAATAAALRPTTTPSRAGRGGRRTAARPASPASARRP